MKVKLWQAKKKKAIPKAARKQSPKQLVKSAFPFREPWLKLGQSSDQEPERPEDSGTTSEKFLKKRTLNPELCIPWKDSSGMKAK